MEWGFGRISGRAGVLLLASLESSWETGPRSDSGMMCGVVSWPSRKLSPFFMVYPEIGMLVLLIIWTSLVALFNGMSAFFERRMTRR
jgi:hypothetical protein